MSPSAEQLIRDYLNQVSVAARTRLHSDDRRAFLARMRFSIERRCGAPGTADPVEVAHVLASLGDPQTLVENERARLQGARGGGVKITGDTLQSGPRLASPQGSPQRRRGAWLVSGTGLGSASASGPKPSNPVINNRPLTGEIKVVSRPITSRWKPGEALQPKQPKVKQPKQPKQPRQPRQPGQPRQARLLRVVRGDKAGRRGAAEGGLLEVRVADPGALENSVAEASAAEIRGAQARGADSSAPEGSVTARGPRGWPGSASRKGSDSATGSGTGAGPGVGARPGSGGAQGQGGGTGLNGVYGEPRARLRRPGDVPAPGPGGQLGAGGELGAGGPPKPRRPGDGDDPESSDLRGPDDGAASDLEWFPGMGPRTSATLLPADRRQESPDLAEQLAAAVAGFAKSMKVMWRGYPLEATVVALLVVAGLVYPFPIWLLGFLLWTGGILTALASKMWDTRDKVTGLAVPVVAAIVGTIVVLATGGEHNTARAYAHEIGVAGPLLLRAAVVLGAVYLAWRVRRGPRTPAVPPWNRQHRI
jgi:hypothetical protein